MRFYRVHRRDNEAESVGYLYYTRRIDAEQARRSWLRTQGEYAEAVVETVNIEPTKRGILRALKRYANHPDNG